MPGNEDYLNLNHLDWPNTIVQSGRSGNCQSMLRMECSHRNRRPECLPDTPANKYQCHCKVWTDLDRHQTGPGSSNLCRPRSLLLHILPHCSDRIQSCCPHLHRHGRPGIERRWRWTRKPPVPSTAQVGKPRMAWSRPSRCRPAPHHTSCMRSRHTLRMCLPRTPSTAPGLS